MSKTQVFKNKQLTATACILLTSMIWGFAFVAQLKGTDTMGAFTFNAVRSVIGATALIPVMLLFEKGRSDKRERRDTLIAGLIGGTVLFLASNLQQYGIDWTRSPARAGFITGLYMIFTPLAGIFLKRKTTVFTWLGAIVALAGLYALSLGEKGVNGDDFLKGNIVLIIGAIFWSAHILVIDHFVSSTRPIRYSMTQFLVCALLSFIAAFFVDNITVSGIIGGTLPLLYTGILSSGVAYTLQVVGQRHVEPARATVLFSMETVFSALGEFIFLGQILPPIGYLGCGLIFAGIMLSQFKSQKLRNNVQNT